VSSLTRICCLLATLLLSPLGGCGPQSPAYVPGETALQFEVVGKLRDKALNEASGIQALPDGVFVLHNDDGEKLFLADSTGNDLGTVKVEGATNRDWEDLARVPGPEGDLLVIADTGDNNRVHKHASLYFLRLPTRADASGEIPVAHRLRLTYPDGPHDVESVAYDPVSDSLLLMSKRDKPPRLYSIPRDLALWKEELVAEYLGEVPGFRPPDRSDLLQHPLRGMWVSQPTGMDIRRDGTLAAVLTYRSLYLFRREAGESWADAFQQPPIEVLGPPGTHDEAVGFSLDGRSVYVTTERRPAPLYRLDLPDSM